LTMTIAIRLQVKASTPIERVILM